MIKRSLAFASLLVLAGGMGASAADESTLDTATLKAIGTGRAIYLTNCAGCHGALAEGMTIGDDIPVVAPDLTLIQDRDGEFQPIAVRQYIEGRTRHGLGEMPCWEYRFAAQHGRPYSFLQIYNLVKYLDFIQGGVPMVASTGAGRQEVRGAEEPR
jgi:hypothetical protein